MTTDNARFEAARLTDEEICTIVGKVRSSSRHDVLQSAVAVADAATAKALRVQDTRRQALVEALQKIAKPTGAYSKDKAVYYANCLDAVIEIAQAALKGEA